MFNSCLVDERCYSNADCDAPQVCSFETGTCIYECRSDDDCGAGLICVANHCSTRSEQQDSGEELVPLVCPEDMVSVGESFCIDRYEASRPDATEDDAGSDESRATSRVGVLPWQVPDNETAQGACVAAGKDLCDPSQWALACAGSGRTTYGYGDAYEPETCNGIDLYGRSGFRLLPTGSLTNCRSDWGAYDLNGNLWEHVRGGSEQTIRGGAYNCIDSQTLHRCDYIPGNWRPSARGFRCCLVPATPTDGGTSTVDDDASLDAESDANLPEDAGGDGCLDDDAGDPLGADASDAADAGPETDAEVALDGEADAADASDPSDAEPDATDVTDATDAADLTDASDAGPLADSSPDPDASDDGSAEADSGDDEDASVDAADDTSADPDATDVDADSPDGSDEPEAGDADTTDGSEQEDAVADAEPDCPPEMVRVNDFCMDIYEASHEDATDMLIGSSPVAASQPGVLPWYSLDPDPATALETARAACEAAGKRLCELDEWVTSCTGPDELAYGYGDTYIAEICNGIDTFCYCDSEACSELETCPFPHCRSTCGAYFHAEPTGAFPDCINSYGVMDINGNVWELANSTDGLAHYRGGAYNCSDSEALHRCDHDGTWGPSARGFRCCKDLW